MKLGTNTQNRRDFEMAQYQITVNSELLHHLFEKNTKDLRDGTAFRIDLKPNPPSSSYSSNWRLTTTNELILGKDIGMGPILLLLSGSIPQGSSSDWGEPRRIPGSS